MSSLRPFIHHDLHHRPNEVQGRADGTCSKHPTHQSGAVYPKNENKNQITGSDGSAKLTHSANRYFNAMKSTSLQPALFYTPHEATITKNGVFKSRETVNQELYSKEEFTHG